MPSDAAASLDGMYIVQIACSDAECAEEIERVVDSLEEIDDILCECECGTVLVSIAELGEDGGEVIELSFGRDRPSLAA